MTNNRIQVSQAHETPVTVLARAGYQCRYAYARSCDSRTADDVGQDQLVLVADDQLLTFALCDGVSQSFIGSLASRLLAEALIDWLEHTAGGDTKTLTHTLTDRLTTLVKEVQPAVDEFVLADDLAPMLRQVLEQKRSLGSESTFVTGCVDLANQRVVLAWMGDSRIRLWGTDSERTRELGDTFHTSERWSSHKGLVGVPHVQIFPTSGISRILLYSDGLSRLNPIDQALTDEELDELIKAAGDDPESDDISVLEVWFDVPAQELCQHQADRSESSEPSDRSTILDSTNEVQDTELESVVSSDLEESVKGVEISDPVPEIKPSDQAEVNRKRMSFLLRELPISEGRVNKWQLWGIVILICFVVIIVIILIVVGE